MKRQTASILIRGARQLLTLQGSKGARSGAGMRDLGVISDGAVLIRDGLIDAVGPTRRVENLAVARDAVEINAAGRVVMPGFVDSHTHLVFPPSGSSTRDVEGAVRAVRAGTAQRFEARSRACLEAMARHGTTTAEAKTGCGLDESAEMKILRVLAGLQTHPVAVVPTFLLRLPESGEMEPAAVEALLETFFAEFLPKIKRRRLAKFADLLWDCEPGHLVMYARYLEAARRLGFGCKVHADCVQPGAAIAMGIQNLAVSIDHMELASEREAGYLTGSGTMAIVMPYGSFCNGGPNAPARTLVDAGVAVALASNFNPQHTPMLNMQTVVALGCMRLGLTAEEAISAATINGAHALGCAGTVGSIEKGKAADLVMLNVPHYQELCENLGMNLVHRTMKGGEWIYREGDVAGVRA